MKRTQRVLMVLGVSLAMLATSFSAGAEPPVTDDQTKSPEFDAGKVPIGEVIASGMKDDQTCKFDNLEIMREAEESDTSWAVVRISESCDVSVVARWQGAFAERPSEIAPNVDSLETTEESFRQSAGTVAQSTDPMKSLQLASCSTHKQQIIHYGFGGPLDVLTKLIGTMVVCENGSSFTDVSHTGTCVGTDLGAWEWVIERCYSGGIIVGSTTAQTIEKGDFHCSPRNQAPCSASNPDGYDHTLKTVEQKNLGGSALCFVSLTGIDVLGSYKDIIQGCS